MLRSILLAILLIGCEVPESHKYTEELLTAHQTTVLKETEAQAIEIQGYLRLVREIAATPPVNPTLTDSVAFQIALAIYEDSNLTGLPGSFYLGLIRVENPWMDPWIENSYGAVGLTQVVPRYWEGVYPECGEDLRKSIYTQICYGARVYMYYLGVWQDEALALYAYNGCTLAHREASARCTNYPKWVLEYSKGFAEDL